MSGHTVFVGNLDPRANERDIEYEFERYGRIRDIWVARKPPGFSFVEFFDDRDARDAVRGSDGRFILDRRVRVEISKRRMNKGGRSGEPRGSAAVNPKRTDFRVKFPYFPARGSWQKLKDVLRDIGCIPVYCDVLEGVGHADFRTSSDADLVVERLDNAPFCDGTLRAERDYDFPSTEVDDAPSFEGERRQRDASRSRSRSRGRD